MPFLAGNTATRYATPPTLGTERLPTFVIYGAKTSRETVPLTDTSREGDLEELRDALRDAIV